MLSLRSNRIVEIPSSFCQLKSLKILNLVNNRLSELPISMRGMNSLAALWLSGNQVHVYTCTSTWNVACMYHMIEILMYLCTCTSTCVYFYAIKLLLIPLQGRPLIDFQVETDDDGEQWLTCVLFPQQQLNESSGNRSTLFVYYCVLCLLFNNSNSKLRVFLSIRSIYGASSRKNTTTSELFRTPSNREEGKCVIACCYKCTCRLLYS